MSETNGATPVTYSCAHPGCKVTGPADRMWNLNDETIICGRHAHEARKQGVRAYRLTDTFAHKAKLARERAESEAFFSKFKGRNASQGRVTLGQAVGVEKVRQMRERTAT